MGADGVHSLPHRRRQLFLGARDNALDIVDPTSDVLLEPGDPGVDRWIHRPQQVLELTTSVVGLLEAEHPQPDEDERAVAGRMGEIVHRLLLSRADHYACNRISTV